MQEQLIGLIIFALIGSCAPGPNNILLASIGSNVGFKKGLPALSAVALGFIPLCFCIALGVGASINHSSLLQGTIKWVGLVILLWLCFKIATAPILNIEQKNVTFNDKATFMSLFLWQWMNPKSWIVLTTAISVYMNNISNIVHSALLFTVIFGTAAIISLLLWLIFGTFIRRFLQKPLWQRVFNLTMTGLLLLSIVPIYIR